MPAVLYPVRLAAFVAVESGEDLVTMRDGAHASGERDVGGDLVGVARVERTHGHRHGFTRAGLVARRKRDLFVNDRELPSAKFIRGIRQWL